MTDERGRWPDPASIVVALFVGAAGMLFLVEPVVDPFQFGSLRVRPVALAALVFTVGMLLGAGIYLRRGNRLVGLGHAVVGVSWGLIVAGTAFASELVFYAGIVLLVAGLGWLVTEAREQLD
ncbi:hypothetical protein [Natronomonas sp. EA1]|uniref:hypothetical protein n=1 Tax=Natronomonas sp. EA1 TaxID=3421655 RepID=UPI003EB86AE7